MVQRVKTLAMQDGRPEFDPGTHCERRKATPTSCPLTSTCMPHTHHSHAKKQSMKAIIRAINHNESVFNQDNGKVDRGPSAVFREWFQDPPQTPKVLNAQVS